MFQIKQKLFQKGKYVPLNSNQDNAQCERGGKTYFDSFIFLGTFEQADIEKVKFFSFCNKFFALGFEKYLMLSFLDMVALLYSKI